jgi:hypothetical protein
MGHWNHRVVKRTYPAPSNETCYQIHEAYYGLDGDNKPSITANPVDVSAESVEGLREVLKQMLLALNTPVLDYETREEILC